MGQCCVSHTSTGKTLAAMAAILARFNVVSDGLATAPKRHAPIFEKTDDGLALLQPWCTGFLAAMRLRYDQWRPLLDVAATCSASPCSDHPARARETEEFLRSACKDIPLALPEIRAYWMPQRLKENDRQA